MAQSTLHEKPLSVIIAGAGIGGLSLAIFLERAQIDYTIIERSPSMRTVGGAIAISAQAFRVFNQIGLFDELKAISKPLTGVSYFTSAKKMIGRVDASGWEKRYGYSHRLFERYELMEVLLRHVPPHKIQWNKNIQATIQDAESVTLVCTDGSHFKGDVLIGADGAYSAVRRSLYKNMQERGVEFSKRDLEDLRFEQFAILGVTADISDEWPILKGPDAEMEVVVASRDIPYNIYANPIPGGRINWMVSGNFQAQTQGDDDFRFSDWESESVKAIMREIENIPITIGGTIGNVLRKTDRTQITRTMLEDMLFSVWYDGRTCLIGDAIHKTLPAGGQGANQAVLDAVCIANLLHELPSNSVEDLTKAFARFRECRYSGSKQAVESSAVFTKLIKMQGLLADWFRSIFLNWLPSWIIRRAQDSVLGERPLLVFVPPIVDKGELEDNSKPHTTKTGHTLV